MTRTAIRSNIFTDLNIEYVEFWWKASDELKTVVKPNEASTYDDNDETHKKTVSDLVHSVLLDERIHEFKPLAAADGYLELEENMIRFTGYADFQDGRGSEHSTLHEFR